MKFHRLNCTACLNENQQTEITSVMLQEQEAEDSDSLTEKWQDVGLIPFSFEDGKLNVSHPDIKCLVDCGVTIDLEGTGVSIEEENG